MLGGTAATAALLALHAAQPLPTYAGQHAQPAAVLPDKQFSTNAFINNGQSVEVYNVATSQHITTLQTQGGILTVASDQNRVYALSVIAGSVAQISRYNATTGSLLGTLTLSSPTGSIGQPKLVVGADHALYVLTGGGSQLKLTKYDGETGAELDTLFDFATAYPDPSHHSLTVDSMKLAPDGKIALLDSVGKSVHLVDPRTKAITTIDLQAAGKPLNRDLTFAPDGSIFIPEDAVNITGAAQPYQGETYHFAADGAYLGALDTQLVLANGITYGPGNVLYICDQDQIVRFDAVSGQSLGAFTSADGNSIVFGGHARGH